MDIVWLGHACFRLKGKEVSLITDPCDPASGYTLGKYAADIVTSSHAHPGHSYFQGIDGNPRIIKGPGEYEVASVLITGIATFHDAERGVRLGKNTVYVIEMEGITLCHLGDLGHTLSPQQIEALDDINVLLVPVGGVSTIGPAIAAEIVRQLNPKIVLPMHYKTDAVKKELEPVGRFLKESGRDDILPKPRLSVTKSNLPESTQLVLLEYPH